MDNSLNKKASDEAVKYYAHISIKECGQIQSKENQKLNLNQAR
jgi:hypothetical protein